MYKVVYKQGNFIDYKGAQVNFILAAVSIPTNTVLVPVDEDGFEDPEKEQYESTKILSLGIAVQRSEDTWDEERGKQIAYGKAIKRRNHVLAATDRGIINTKVVEAILAQEASYMQVNPGRYIAGYDEARDKYLAAKAKEEYMNSLTAEEKLAINVVASVKDPQKFLKAVEDRRKELATSDSIINSNSSNVAISN